MKKDNVIFLLMLISGLIIGSYLGSIAVIVPWLEWLNYGKTIGLTQPLGFIYLQFALHISFTIAGIIGMVIASIIFKFIRR